VLLRLFLSPSSNALNFNLTVNMLIRVFLFFVFSVVTSLGLASCSPAQTTFQPETFVPNKELLAVSLAREGLSNYQRNRFLDAEFRLRQALYLAPEAENILVSLAIVLETQERFSEASQIFEELLMEYPDSVYHLLGAGRSKYREGLYEEAKTYFLKAYENALEENDNVQASRSARNLSLVSFITGLEMEALCYSAEAVAHRETPEEILRHTRLLIGLLRYESAQRVLDEYSSRVNIENDSRFLALLASLSLTRGEFSEVIDFADRALAMPDVSTARFKLELMRAHSIQFVDEVDSHLQLDFEEHEPDTEELAEEPIVPATPAEVVASVRLDLISTIYWPVALLEILDDALQLQEDIT